MKNTLPLLIDRAREARDQAAAARRGAAQNLQRASERLALLKQFCGEYEQRLQEQRENGISRSELNNFSRFVQQLDQALKQQTTEVEFCERTLLAAQSQLTETQQRMRSLEVLLERQHAEQRRILQRKDQKLHDEFSARIARQSIERQSSEN